MAAEITEIVSKEAIQSIVSADKAITGFDDNIQKLINNIKVLTTSMNGETSTLTQVNTAIKQTETHAKALTEVEKQQIKIQKDLESAAKSLDNQRKAGLAVMAKAEQKERELQAALKMEVKSLKDAEIQNKALNEAKKRLDLTTQQGRQKLLEYNASLNQNTNFIRANATEAGKQKMNIGNYKSAVMGLVGALGITAGLAGALKFAQSVMMSTGRTADSLERSMSGVREMTNYFSRALSTMDFTNFIQGMRDANTEGRRYFDMLDMIADEQRALGLQKTDIDTEIIRQRIIAKNRQNDIATREAAVNRIVELEQEKLDKTSAIANTAIDNELTNASARSKVDKSVIADLIENYKEREKIVSDGNAIIAKIEAETRVKSYVGQAEVTIVDIKAREKAYKELSIEQLKSIEYAKAENTLTDEQKDRIRDAMQANKMAIQEQVRGQEELVMIKNRLYKELIREEDATQKAIEKQLNAYEKVQKRIEELKKEIKLLNFEGKEIPRSLTKELSDLEKVTKKIEDETKNIAINLAMKSAPLGITTSLLPKQDKFKLKDRQSTEDISITDPDTFLKLEEDAKNMKIEAAQITADSIFNIIRGRDQAALEGKLSDLDKEKDAKLKNSKLTEAQKAKIEADYDAKSRKLKNEAAKKEKTANIIEAIIQGALSVLRAPIPLKPLAVLQAAAGLATIIAQPVPKYDAGIESTPNTPFWAGERRPEYMIKQGQVSLITRPTLFENMAGATIIGGADTERIMKAGGPVAGINSTQNMDSFADRIVDAIRNKSELHISASGERITERKGSYNTEYFNRKITWLHRQN